MRLGIERHCPLCKQVIVNAITDEELEAEKEAALLLDLMSEADEEPCLSWESGMEN